jgi:hypothetical protein
MMPVFSVLLSSLLDFFYEFRKFDNGLHNKYILIQWITVVNGFQTRINGPVGRVSFLAVGKFSHQIFELAGISMTLLSELPSISCLMRAYQASIACGFSWQVTT